MSDFYNNDPKKNESGTNGNYSYKKDEINQGESYYQWSPYDDGRKSKKSKKSGGFGAKLGKTAAIALVFGLVAGITFQSVALVTDKFYDKDLSSNHNYKN